MGKIANKINHLSTRITPGLNFAWVKQSLYMVRVTGKTASPGT
jgi:hypothetical protein